MVATTRMAQTVFRTYALNAVGTAGGAVEIVPARAHAQRVVLYHGTLAASAMVSTSAAELDQAVGAFPFSAFAVFPFTALVFALPARERLVAAASVAGLPLSVATSQAVPYTPGLRRALGRTTFRRFAALTVADGAPIQVAQAGAGPQRVLLSRDGGLAPVSLSSAPNALADAFAIPIGAGVVPTLVFIKAPGQELYALDTGVGAAVSVSVSDISVDLPRGPTGVPGPDGQE